MPEGAVQQDDAGAWSSAIAHALADGGVTAAAGTVGVNSYRVVAPNVPFGGVGSSGWGRESGLEAVKAYTETKAIWIELDGLTRDPFRMG